MTQVGNSRWRAGYILFLFFIPLKIRRPFYWYFWEVAPFYCLFERRRHFIDYIWEKGWCSFFLQNFIGLADSWFFILHMVNALSGGLVVQIKLFYWCGLRNEHLINKNKSQSRSCDCTIFILDGKLISEVQIVRRLYFSCFLPGMNLWITFCLLMYVIVKTSVHAKQCFC